MDSRFVQTHPRPDPPGGLYRNRSEIGQPDYSNGRWRVFSTRNRFRQVGFGFYTPKSQKTRADRRKTHILIRKFLESGKKKKKKKPKSRPKNPDLGNISRRSGEILNGFGEISSNPMRLLLDLEKSHIF